MKVLIINGSPRLDGNTTKITEFLEDQFTKERIEVDTYQIGTKIIRGCIACGKCHEIKKCVFDDDVNILLEKLKESQGVIIATPVYYASANGSLISLLDRLFYANQFDLTMKVGASIAILRRGGASSTFDELNKYFTISGMPIVSSYYWNSVHGLNKGEVLQDEEGLQTLECLVNNMIFLMKAIEMAKETYNIPLRPKRKATNFIR